MPEMQPNPLWKKRLNRVAAWLGERNLMAVVALLIVTAGIWAFIELADEVMEGETQALDRQILELIRSPEDPGMPVGPHWLREAAPDVTALGGITVLSMLTVAVTGFCLLAGNRIAMWTMLAAGIGGLLFSMLLKDFLYRTRPAVVPHLVDVSTPSFPSGHSMMSAAVYLTLGVLLATFVRRKRLKTYFIGVALTVTLLVGASRVYLGVHYPTDVLAGWTAGSVWAVICGFVAHWLQPRRQTLLDEAPAPEAADTRKPASETE